MADILLILGIATFLHYFGIFTFHTEHYWSLIFLFFSIGFFFSYWESKLNGGKNKNKGEQK